MSESTPPDFSKVFGAPTPNVRAAALAYMREQSRSNERRRDALADVAPIDRGLFVELTAGTTRTMATLDAILAAYSSVRLERIEEELVDILRLGIYQIVYMRSQKDFAAVNETVELVPRRRGPKTRGFVNAILRRIASSIRKEAGTGPIDAKTLEIDDDERVVFDRDIFPHPEKQRRFWQAEHYGFSDEAVEMLAEGRDDAELERILKLANRRPAHTLRIDPSRIAPEALLSRLAEEGLSATQRPDGLFEIDGGDPAATPAFREGLFAVQGPFAARVAPLVGPKKGARILDLCAAPGGKSCHIAALEPAATVTAIVVHAQGERMTRENVKRLGLKNVEVVRWAKDPRFLPKGPFDAILLDVPCTNTAVLNRRPEARHALTRAALKTLIETQEYLLHLGLTLAEKNPAGCRVVYSTCSILTSEGKTPVARALAAHPRAKLISETRHVPAARADDGGYAAVIEVK